MLVQVIHARMVGHVELSMEMAINVFVSLARQASIVKLVSML